MANIQCASTGNKIELTKKSPNRAMANAIAVQLNSGFDHAAALAAIAVLALMIFSFKCH